MIESPSKLSEVRAKCALSNEAAAKVASLGSHPESMTQERAYAFARAAEQFADAAMVWRSGVFYVATRTDDKAPVVHLADTVRVLCTADEASIDYDGARGAKRRLDTPVRLAVGPSVVEPASITEAVKAVNGNARRQRSAKRLDVGAWIKRGNSKRIVRHHPEHDAALNLATLNQRDRTAQLVAFRSNGHRANSLRYVADALVQARFDGASLACAVLAAVLRAGTIKVLAPLPLRKCSVKQRRNPPCDGLAQHIAEDHRVFAEHAPQTVIIEAVRPYFRFES